MEPFKRKWPADYKRLHTFSHHLVCLLLLFILTGCATFYEDNYLVPLSPLEQARAIGNENDEQYLKALRYWKEAQTVVDTKITTLSKHLQEIALLHAQKGVDHYSRKEGREARDQFIKALKHDPNNGVALSYLKERYKALEYIPYTVQLGDTTDIIAEEVYGSPDNSFAVQHFSGVSVQRPLLADTVIHLPLLSSMYSPQLLQYKRDIIVARNLYRQQDFENLLPLAEKILSTYPNDKEGSYILNSALVGLGKKLLIEEQYERAADTLSRVDPTFKDVKEDIAEIRELHRKKLKRDAIRLNTILFRKGESLFSQRKYLEALEVLSEVDPEFEGVNEVIANIREAMEIEADVHYKRGVTLFVDDKLDAAIAEWEKTLRYDPHHEKAMQYIENARKLLEKFEAIN